MEKVTIYGKKQLEPGNSNLIDFESFTLGIKRHTEGWFIKTFDKNTVEEKPSIDEIATGTYYHTGKSNSLYLTPALPAKPMVLKGSRLVISPHQRLTFFVKVPLMLQLYSAKKQEENLLTEFPFQQISDTWFGETVNGEPAYALESEEYLEINEIVPDENFAVCPVNIFNNDSSPLAIERLILRVDQLHLLRFKEYLITSMVKLEYKGKDHVSAVNYGFSKALHGENHDIVAKPRNPEGKSLLKINFHFIKNIYRSE
ncbi:DUF432 domain-containing protein [Draconibacterium sp. IB214405]|uniref:DUF432 domain-containing protein n=1 Tax=Draconibacterium sp. IB214405 TaxID=3097352 RepID=UPI002A0D2AD2|nr:DUF432 domain-containing protein [Draconibacterium sp. IB214405]MDX8339983.1 DUF432 domain-containing protein [Draconibacterium sp. IB214405]